MRTLDTSQFDKWTGAQLGYFAGILTVIANQQSPGIVAGSWERVNARLTITQREWLAIGEPDTVRSYFLDFIDAVYSSVRGPDYLLARKHCEQIWRPL